MKSNTNKLILIYTLTTLTFVVIGHQFSQHFVADQSMSVYSFFKDIIFVILTSILLKLILSKNDAIISKNFNRLKKSNDAIRESNDKYDIVAKATSDTIWDWKLDEDHFSWNKGIESVFGYSQNEVAVNSNWWFDKIHPEDSIKMSVRLYSFIEQKTEKWQDQYRFKCADNTYKYVLDRAFLLKDKNGKAIRMIGAIQDITKQKEEENRLKLLETVIIQSKDAIIITEPKSTRSKIPNIIYVNPAFTIMSGYTSDEITGKSPDLFKSPNSDDNALSKLFKAIDLKKECQIETILSSKTKKEYWVRLSMVPIFNTEKELSHWISILRDISEEKRQEKEKEQLIRELTQNNTDLKQFSYITSHNLRAPLSNLTGLLQLLEEIPIHDAELQEILNGFNQSTLLLNNTVNDLVKVITIKDKPAILKEKIVLNDLFQNVFIQLDTLITTHHPVIELDFKTPTLYSHKPYLESIFVNLVSNAIKYKSETRDLKIRIASQKVNNTTVIHIQDNGIGIDLIRNKDKIFGLYQRFHLKPDSKGLGLYLVKSQVEIMGGTIEIESEINKGTTLKLTFKNLK
ncbi:PAS domain S-box protein [Flavobacterium sp. FPG59]|jgi:PAS domain S-box-containing protein|uniref:PAS domain-containing sensor histidine kinase n=1 Tax=Flavobacterium sp. FPG59 TaxID=1929267 RepID=UPI000A39182E|nr:PAS domain S-box protein [Flavobacterium sp. FPG59]OUD36378.1 PAS domain-containing sensor histidine kinase [Flavobacterium sp. FPG59]